MPNQPELLPQSTLSISIVCYQPDLSHLQLLLFSLSRAIKRLSVQGDTCRIILLNHGHNCEKLLNLCRQYQAIVDLQVLENPDNPGFGAGHNRVIEQVNSQYHLILNPDVVLPDACLVTLLAWLRANPELVAVCPEVRDETGKLQYLCKTAPTLVDLALRGFAPQWLKARFRQRLARYECRAMVEARQSAGVSLMSGCFMLCTTSALKIHRFDERYFLYFEDFVLSRQLQKIGQLQYVPDACIVHFGGNSARKGLLHIRYFLASAWRYFNQFGWRLW